MAEALVVNAASELVADANAVDPIPKRTTMPILQNANAKIHFNIFLGQLAEPDHARPLNAKGSATTHTYSKLSRITNTNHNKMEAMIDNKENTSISNATTKLPRFSNNSPRFISLAAGSVTIISEKLFTDASISAFAVPHNGT
ncbi:hypothetical protein ACU19_08330 [Actinobaculum suis]|nr:hypothetical protein ACU19_08330 [Actinobaculum suis]